MYKLFYYVLIGGIFFMHHIFVKKFLIFMFDLIVGNKRWVKIIVDKTILAELATRKLNKQLPIDGNLIWTSTCNK